MDCILVRYGEISLKSDFVRAEFERILMHNISEALNRDGIAVEKIVKHGARIFIFCKELDKAIKILQNVFGIVSVSPAYIIKSELEVFNDWAMKIYSNEAGKTKKSFRITARRQDKNFPLDSMEIGKIVGEYVFEKSGAPVDLHNPDININFEISSENTYAFSHTYQGWGGLPIGSQGRVICVFNRSREAILSIFEMMRRGCQVTVLCKKSDNKNLGSLAKSYYVCNEKLRVYNTKAAPDELARFEGAGAIVYPLWFDKIRDKEINEIKKKNIDFPVFLPLISFTKDELPKLYKKLSLKAASGENFLEICQDFYISKDK